MKYYIKHTSNRIAYELEKDNTCVYSKKQNGTFPGVECRRFREPMQNYKSGTRVR